jgi:hypothetical protein
VVVRRPRLLLLSRTGPAPSDPVTPLSSHDHLEAGPGSDLGRWARCWQPRPCCRRPGELMLSQRQMRMLVGGGSCSRPVSPSGRVADDPGRLGLSGRLCEGLTQRWAAAAAQVGQAMTEGPEPHAGHSRSGGQDVTRMSLGSSIRSSLIGRLIALGMSMGHSAVTLAEEAGLERTGFVQRWRGDRVLRLVDGPGHAASDFDPSGTGHATVKPPPSEGWGTTAARVPTVRGHPGRDVRARVRACSWCRWSAMRCR